MVVARTLLMGVFTAVAACGSVAPPSSSGDLGQMTNPVCESYCVCMAANCASAFASSTSCLSTCGQLNNDDRGCRDVHCGLAKMAKAANNAADQSLHCGHAVGVGLCPP